MNIDMTHDGLTVSLSGFHVCGDLLPGFRYVSPWATDLHPAGVIIGELAVENNQFA